MFDLTPLYRTTIGFDRLAEMLDEVLDFDVPAYPPYNIERVEDDTYRITMAVAGFNLADLSVAVNGHALTIAGKKTDEKPDDGNQFLHQGIASHAFERRFQLADSVEIRGAQLENGLLHVVLRRELPEAMKPRTIAIQGQAAGSKGIADGKAA